MKNILYLLLLYPFIIFAQTDNNAKQRNESYLTTDLFSPFFIHYRGFRNTPRWRLGYVVNLNEKSKFGIDIGYGLVNISIIETGDKYSLWEIRPEYYQILSRGRKAESYISFEFFYINQYEEFIHRSFFSDQNEVLAFDKADYNRQKLGLVYKVGMFVNLTERIGFNWYIGIGLNYRINNYDNFLNLRTEEYDTYYHHPPYYYSEDSTIGVEFTLGVKLYYRIKNQ